MDSLTPLMRKFEFPECVVEALKIVHLQCEKMSLNTNSPLSQELSQVTDFVDNFVFGNPKNDALKLNYIQQLQVIQALIDHFNGEGDFSLLCTVFTVVFMTKGRNVDFKMDTLSKLLSLNLSEGHETMLNCVAIWWSQQPHDSNLCNQVAHNLVHDYLILLPDTAPLLVDTPRQSPLLAGILLTHFADLFTVSRHSTSFKCPPIQLVRLATSWLMDHKELCGAYGKSDCQTVVTMLSKSPVPGLVIWTVLAPLVSPQDHHLDYSKLHLSLLQHITEWNVDSCFPVSFLSNITEFLLSIFNENIYSDSSISKSLDRYGQAVQAGLAAGATVDEDVLLLVDQLPYNRLIHIITSNIR